MKNIFKMLGIIVFIAVIGFAMTACDNDGGGGGGGGSSASLGTTLNLSGQVFTRDFDYDDDVFSFLPFDGTLAVTAVYYEEFDSYLLGGTGGITAGQLSFSIGTPNKTEPIGELLSYMMENANNLKISDTTVQAIDMNLDTPSGNLFRSHFTATNDERVSYFYVASDVTISADKSVITNPYDGDTETINAFTINLKTGWNAIRNRVVHTSSGVTITVSAANPSNYRWVLFD